MAATHRFRLYVSREGAGFPDAHACSVSSPSAPSSFLPLLHFVRGRWGRWEQIHFRVGKRGGGGEKASLPRGKQDGTEPEPRWRRSRSRSRCGQVGKSGSREGGSVAEMTCGSEWAGEPGEGGLGRGCRGERGLWRRGLRERGVLGAGPKGRGSGG